MNNHPSNFEDKDFIGALLERYRPWSRVFVRQYVYGKLGRRIDESDVIQNAWLSVAQNLDQFRGTTEAEFFAWLKVILNNNLKNVIRDNTAHVRDFRVEQDFAATMDTASICWWEPAAQDSTPSQRLIRGEKAIELAKAMEELPESQKVAIELRHLSGLKLTDVCKAMDKTPDAVVSLIRRGMKCLRASLDGSS